ncbi:MAG: hypothetical protein JNL82_06525 [Myxococcales bacterium]|nr:hypothetical protein [Myxococcales bacterium]
MRRPNPYVGPRSFATGEPLYGRERERVALLDLVIAERVVLLHAPSGAGKSSLLQAGLVPDLIAEGFRVRPPIRVGMDLPGELPGANRFIVSALQSVEDQARPLALLAGLDPADALGEPDDGGEVLIFDQFEEVLTIDPNNREAKHAFFAAVGRLLRSPRRWAVFSMREDYVASLAPYVRAVPTRFKTTFQLELLGVEAAMQAVMRPAEAAGVTFTEAAARRMIDDLRQVKVQAADGSTVPGLGPFVEPVQLQVACRNLWARMPDEDRSIEPADVAAVGDVDAALTEYYESQVAAVAAAADAAERDIRRWIGRALITDQGLRGQVLQAAEASAGLANAVIRRLIDVHLVRAEKRRGATWFELAHDRLIAPVRASNARWTESHLSPVQRQAELWDSSGRPDALLLRERAAAERAAGAAESAVERAFADESLRTIAQVEETERLRKQSLWSRRIIGWMLIVGLVATVGVVVTRYQHEMRAAGRSSRLRWRAEVTAEVARAAEDAARARQLAAELVLLPDEQIELAALLAVAVSRLVDGQDARAGLYALSSRAQWLIGTLAGAARPLRLALSGDGEHLAAVDERAQLVIWRVGAGVRVVVGPPVKYSDVVSDPDSGGFATLRADGTIEFWAPAEVAGPDGAGATFLVTRTLHAGAAESLAVAAGGRYAATLDRAGAVAVIDAGSGAVVARTRLAAAKRGPGSQPLRFTADGEALALAGAEALTLWSWRSGALSTTGTVEAERGATRADPPLALRFVATGLIGVSASGAVRRWPIAAGRLQAPTRLASLAEGIRGLESTGGEAALLAVGFDERGERAVAIGCVDACTRTLLRVWEAGRLHDAAIELPPAMDGGMLPIGVGVDSVFVGGARTAVREFDTRTWRPFGGRAGDGGRQLEPAQGVGAGAAGGVVDAAFAADARRVALIGGDGSLTLWDPATRAAVEPFDAPEGRWRAPVFVGSTLLAAIDGEERLHVWDLAGGARTAERGLTPGSRLLALGAGLLALAPDGALEDARTGRALARLPGLATAFAVVSSADGARLAAGSCGASDEGRCLRGRVQVWDTGRWTALLEAEAHEDAVRRLAFARAGDRLLSGAGDGSLRLWQLSEGTSFEVTAPERELAAIAWDPSDELVATLACGPAGCAASAESALGLRRARTLDPVAPARRILGAAAPAEPSTAGQLAFSADGRLLYTVSRVGVAVWDLDLERMRAAACRLAGRELTPAEQARYLGARREPLRLCAPG